MVIQLSLSRPPTDSSIRPSIILAIENVAAAAAAAAAAIAGILLNEVQT
jgi:hypothetical protein